MPPAVPAKPNFVGELLENLDIYSLELGGTLAAWLLLKLDPSLEPLLTDALIFIVALWHTVADSNCTVFGRTGRFFVDFATVLSSVTLTSYWKSC